MTEIQPIELSENELLNNCTVLARGNAKLKECAAFARMKQRAFRGKLFSAGMNPKEMGLPQKVVYVVNKALPDINAVVALEGVMFNANVRLAWKLAHRASKWLGQLSYHDYEQEAYMALVDAHYGYTNINRKFSTLAWHAINRRLMKANNDDNQLSPWSKEANELMRRFNETKQSMSCVGQTSDAVVIESLCLSNKELAILRDCLHVVINESSLHVDQDQQEDYKEDYTSYRCGLEKQKDNGFVNFEQKDDGFVNFEIQDVIERAGLTKLERHFVEYAMVHGRGSATRLSETHVSDYTGEPISRMRVHQIMNRAKKKISRAYYGEVG